MRNLKLQFCKQFATNLQNANFLLLNPNESASCEIIYLATENKLYTCNTDRGTLIELAELPGIVGCEYLALDNEICVAASSGEVLLINPETKTTNEGTYCDVGIECMAWSPDQEVVVFVTRTHKVVVMTCTYDAVTEHPLADTYFGSGQFVSVGWGKKETQFHGSEGKAAAKAQPDLQSPAQLEIISHAIEITWRGDAAYFGVSYHDHSVGRAIKVFDKEGSLKYTSERMAELQSPIAWRPSGTWLAMPQKFNNKSTVALIEKNGLRHREIVLPFSLDLEPIKSIKWSPDSEILCVETTNKAVGSNNLYLYTIGNYHWYLKQVLSFKIDNLIAEYVWDNRIGEEKTLHILLEDGKYLVYRWHFGITKHSDGLVLVIDGNKLLITDFSKSIVPPPMCNQELKIESFINECGFVITKGETIGFYLFVLDAANCVHFYKRSLDNKNSFEQIFTLTHDANVQSLPLQIHNMIWFNCNVSQTMKAVATKTLLNLSQILYIGANLNENIYEVQDSFDFKDTINCLSEGRAELSQFYVQTTNGRIQQICVIDEKLKLGKQHAVLTQGTAESMHWYSSLSHEGLITLRSNQCLYINAEFIADDVTSYCMAGNYLAFTKLVTLQFVRLSDQKIVSERKIERGAKLVTIITKDARTVMQLPRGNLESISPRVLALEIVGLLLEREEYDIAMDMLRKQRINLNIICDHNILSFVENLKVFLHKIQNPNWLNLFLSDLQNEDFTTTMYASNYKEGSQLYPESFKIEEKVLYICEKLCELMEQNFEPRFRLPIITAYVKLGKAEKALNVIWQDKQSESLTNADSKDAENALKYLLYLVDVNELYNLALGTYDFGLVLFVAQKSQKDPREFLPFLNELKLMEPNYRKFKIDEHLKRNEKALYNIAQCGELRINEAIKFVEQHALFQQALKCYEHQDKCYQQICCAFADNLRSNGKLENASIIYERANMLSQALLCAKNSLDWQRALVLARQDGQNVENVALSMVPALEEQDKHADAFHILMTYGNNFSESIKCLLRAKLFSRAIFEVRMQAETGHQDLIAKLVHPDLLSYATLLDSTLTTDKELFVGYKQRLLKIRLDKQKHKELGESLYDKVDVDECDLLSDTTSMHSSRYTGSSRGSTGKTFRSSKNRRKHERKLLSLKPGNPFEDIALIDALHNHIMKVVAQQPNIRDTCKALMELREDKMARTIQHQYKSLLKIIHASLDEIWIPEIMIAQNFLTGPNIDYTQLQNEQRYAMIDPLKRFKPQFTIKDWEHEVLR